MSIRDELSVWLHGAFQTSGMSKAEIARRLTEALNRNITGVAVTRMLSGQRAIFADEMLAIARICRVPLPSPQAKRGQQPRLPGLDPAERRAS